ncbi:histidine-rich glycoprotein [Tetranychus urticae]|uniref:Uncharacterized protein n=1 Tax=Tetranychus urticae TaxID=32264 RepID=T1KEQ1_TETUR|nr:histidine-rich glycoprotein [Tetranychus urticae]XP_025016911.1 histidine-rich glycoprotein [Tetranychus urticae]
MCGIIFKAILCFGVLAVVAHATGHGGHSNTHRKQDAWGNYEFGYDIVDPWGAKNYRQESGDGWGNKWGSYGIRDSDGRLRIVEYVADGHGFRAKIKTNEPGTSNKDSAAAIYNGPDAHGYSHDVVKSGSVAPHFNHGSYKHELKHGHGGHDGYDKIHHAPAHHDAHHDAHHEADYGHDGWSHEVKHVPVHSYKHKEVDHYPSYHHEPSHHGQSHYEPSHQHESGWGSSADNHDGYGYGGDLAGYGNHYSLRYLRHKK